MSPTTTMTRRGLILTFYSEVPLVAGAVPFLVLPKWPAFLVVGVLLSMLVGLPAALTFWAGRKEFGRAFDTAVKRTFLAFIVLALSLFLVFFQLNSVVPSTLKISDLWAPFVFLGLALAADVAAMMFLLWPLLQPAHRRWLFLILGLGVVGLAAHAVNGYFDVSDYVSRSGGTARDVLEARSYARDFAMEVVWVWTMAALALRIGFWPALRLALANVIEAEAEFEAATASDPLPPT